MPEKKLKIWTTDWFTGLVYSVVFLLSVHVLAQGFFYGIETAAYDRAMAMSSLEPSSDVAVVEIDDDSIDKIGRWPWSRDILAQVIDRLSQGGAETIVLPIFLSGLNCLW